MMRRQQATVKSTMHRPVVGADGEILEAVQVEIALANVLADESAKNQPPHPVTRLAEWMVIVLGLLLFVTAIIGLLLLVFSSQSQRSQIGDWVTLIMLVVGFIDAMLWGVTATVHQTKRQRDACRERKPHKRGFGPE